MQLKLKMNQFYEDMAALTSNREPVKVGCMRHYEIDKRELQRRKKKELIIEFGIK